MSHIGQLSAAVPAQSISEVLSPGIISIFVQGLETGIILSQFFQWLYHQRTEGIVITVLVVFVTTVGFVESAICFASAWRIYVLDFGQTVHHGWTEAVHAMLSTLVAAPIQAYLIWRCYYILKKNLYLIMPLIVTLLSTIVSAGWVTAWIFRMHATGHPTPVIEYPFVVFLTLPVVLDFTIASILLFSLTKFLKSIHAEHLRNRITRYMIAIWQAAIPPALCAVALLIKYIVFTKMHPGQHQMWYPVIQAMLGKLYVLSLYFTLNNRMDLTNEPPVTYFTTMGASLDGVGSPAQRYVFSTHCSAREQQC